MPFKIGHTTNVGRKLNDETRKKMSESHQGKKPATWGAGYKKGNTPWNKGIERRAYFAGLVDGEGSIYISANTNQSEKYRKVCVAICMRADKAQPLYEGQEHWGGSLNQRKPRKSNHSWALDWKIYTKNAEKFLEDIKPFLRIKKEQAELVLKYRWLQTRRKQGTNEISEEEWETRQVIENKIKELNGKQIINI